MTGAAQAEREACPISVPATIFVPAIAGRAKIDAIRSVRRIGACKFRRAVCVSAAQRRGSVSL